MKIQRSARAHFAIAFWIGASALLGCGSSAERARAEATGENVGCTSDAVADAGGQRRLALVVGVGQYKAEKVPDLAGPPNDARRIYELLTGESGFAFPRQNVCLLLNEQATTAAFRKAFDEALVARARPQDLAVIFYAGHGSQAKDRSGDEPDGWDETLMLHDARVEGQRDLVDDEFHGMLQRLHAQTSNIVVILDSCNSGTATRDGSGAVARFFEPSPDGDSSSSGEGDGDEAWGDEALTGVVTLTAASDGTSALERDGKGIFTDALIRVLGERADRSLTYAQLARQVPPLVLASSYQIPYFQGDLQRKVFDAGGVRRALGWEVVTPGSTVTLSGPPLPGMGVGAELRVVDGAKSDASDPTASKGILVITQTSGVNAEARVATRSAGAPPIAAGDLAVLVRPGDDFIRLKVSVRAPGASGGIEAPRADALRAAIQNHAEAGKLVEIVKTGGEFELSAGEGRLLLRGPEDRIRNAIERDAEVPEVLWQHARQRALLQIRAEGGQDFNDDETLQVRVVPARTQSPCADGEWVQAAPNQEQVIPLCHSWNIEVTLVAGAPKPLLIGGLILSADGSTFGFPGDGQAVLLKPGEKHVFDSRADTFRSTLPLDTRDQILVFGTQERNPVPWYLLTRAQSDRASRGVDGGTLYRALDRYLQPGVRGVEKTSETVDESTWTKSSVSTRVEANARFASSRGAGPTRREYTIPRFDVRPYLPDDTRSALYLVLQKADGLARSSATDGFGYKQHDWSQGSDDANLRLGIDCSRAIWFAFTRNQLPYNRGDRFLSTSMMVGPDSPMADEFDACPAEGDLAIGDLLVYRGSPARGDGHVVMVIDPAKRIAWGSHGWDGEARDQHYAIEPDTGIEYQRIKYKADWRRWDRSDMELRACWRYRRFASEARSGRGVPGVAALAKPCDESACRR